MQIANLQDTALDLLKEAESQLSTQCGQPIVLVAFENE